ncbi:hypothetical protein C7T94_15355 [Pedobacter yulinensis]|uniref:VCBS repeat-containing protein n=1 Tax=Pedobacter yulinensis TaxID=2126353 RepID=A0A2T3HI98_9SPHI|nr:hypothetical protein [Pedobacter yulinensis]PST82176.1 hypothetical protein C7T94_15355 [Pedobacter yulinensis]
MKYLLILLLVSCLVVSLPAQQPFVFPALKKAGMNLQDLIPKNWYAIDTAYGDLNGDQVSDVVLVLEHRNAVREHRAYGDNTTEIIAEHQRPRMLAAYFATKNKALLRLALQNNDFVLRASEGGKLGDPYRDVSIDKGALRMRFSGGNSWRWNLDYQFRYKGTAWVLTAANSEYFHQETGEMTSRSFDFILQEVEVVSGSIHSRASGNATFRESLRDEPMRTFLTFKKPWAWEILPGTYL